MNYEPNTTTWKAGDLVIHDADAKKAYMLMRVVGYTRQGLVKTRYIDPNMTDHDNYKSTKEIWTNEPKYLHDPAGFGIEVGA